MASLRDIACRVLVRSRKEYRAAGRTSAISAVAVSLV